MSSGNILFIGGSLNQTKMMHAVSEYFGDFDVFFTHYYADGFLKYFANIDLLNFTVLGGRHKEMTLKYLKENNLKIDIRGEERDYDLIFTSSDLLIQKNIRGKKIVLVQEGMTDPENIFFFLVKYLKFPRWLASTSTTGLSNSYNYFCVASQGYKNLFIRKGVKEEKLKVTGIPNFDNVKQYRVNNFPYKGFVLVATSDSRETFKYENRKKFILRCSELAKGKQLIFKLHPNENFKRATKEINTIAPDAVVFCEGDINYMIANCSILITRYSSVVYIGLALGKVVHSYFDINALNELLPIQNDGMSAYNIAQIGYQILSEKRYYRMAENLEPAMSKS